MPKIIITQTRPSTNVEFFAWSEDVRDHIFINFMQTSKMITDIDNFYSHDALTKTTTFQFDTMESLEEFRNDTEMSSSRAQKAEYDAVNGITQTGSIVD
jgi:hypothetical protein